MRVYLEQGQVVQLPGGASVTYAAGFYDAPDALAREWVANGAAKRATADNRVIETLPAEPVDEPAPLDASAAEVN